MDIDFHFSTIYVLSRWAGFGSHNAKVIAASSQFVDDNISDDPRILATAEKMDADGRIIRYSGHELWENLLNDEGNEQVWVPYHFLPGLQGDTEEEKLVCKKNSILSIALADKLAGISMSDTDYAFKLGIGLHVLADTWAHQEFSGVITRRNIVLGLVFKNFDSELWQKVLYFIDGIASIGCNVSEPLGHAAAIHWPDRPYAAWKSQTKFVSGRNNWEEFLEACRCIYKILTNVNGGIPKELTKEQEGLLQDTFRGIFVEQENDRNEEWIKRIQTNDFGFSDFDEDDQNLRYSKYFILSDSDYYYQFYDSLNEYYEWVKGKLIEAGIEILQ